MSAPLSRVLSNAPAPGIGEAMGGEWSLAEVFNPLDESELLLQKWDSEAGWIPNPGCRGCWGQVCVFSSPAPLLLCCSLGSSLSECLLG